MPRTGNTVSFPRPISAVVSSLPTAGHRPVSDPQVGSAFVSVKRLSARADGARIVSQAGTDLIVAAAPVEEVALLLGRTELASSVAYIILSHTGDALEAQFVEAEDVRPFDVPNGEAKIGETGKPRRRWREHRRRPPVAGEMVFFIASVRADGLSKDEILALQYALTHQALRAGRCRIVGSPPERGWLQQHDPGLMTRWLCDARALLVVAGCHLLEPRGAAMRPPIAPTVEPEPVVLPAPPVLVPLRSGYRVVPSEICGTLEASRHQLSWGGAQVTVIDHGEGAVVIEAGSRFAARLRSGVQPCIARKLAHLQKEGLLHGGSTSLQLAKSIQVSSLTNAMRLATASNRPVRGMWTPVT